MAAYTWVSSSVRQSIPHNAVQGGFDSDGSKIYIGRTHHMGDIIPCKIVPQRRAAYISYNMQELSVTNYEVMCEQKFHWVNTSGRSIPFGAVEGGRTSNGEPLYVGRVRHQGSHTVGKVHPSHGCLYIPYGGKEISFTSYEVLVVKP